MSLTLLSQMSAPVLAATLWMDPPAAQYRPPYQTQSHPRPVVTRQPRLPWRSRVKALVRPIVPRRVRTTVRLVVINNPAPSRAEPTRSDETRRAA